MRGKGGGWGDELDGCDCDGLLDGMGVKGEKFGAIESGSNGRY